MKATIFSITLLFLLELAHGRQHEGNDICHVGHAGARSKLFYLLKRLLVIKEGETNCEFSS